MQMTHAGHTGGIMSLPGIDATGPRVFDWKGGVEVEDAPVLWTGTSSVNVETRSTDVERATRAFLKTAHEEVRNLDARTPGRSTQDFCPLAESIDPVAVRQSVDTVKVPFEVVPVERLPAGQDIPAEVPRSINKILELEKQVTELEKLVGNPSSRPDHVPQQSLVATLASIEGRLAQANSPEEMKAVAEALLKAEKVRDEITAQKAAYNALIGGSTLAKVTTLYNVQESVSSVLEHLPSIAGRLQRIRESVDNSQESVATELTVADDAEQVSKAEALLGQVSRGLAEEVAPSCESLCETSATMAALANRMAALGLE
ncbi:hypothetical protein DIPPA_07673 [Diplonema papillatum]|nr:hypothetical protein DIPPA_07673 [Diplonema papillatum]